MQRQLSLKRLSVFFVLVALLLTLVPQSAFAAPAPKPLLGKTISIIGDTISTYMGWSDAHPITDESCTNRYGEPYYGPVGADCFVTDLLVTDTWWHQAATELGTEIHTANIETLAGVWESVPVEVTGNTRWARNHRTEKGMTVQYDSSLQGNGLDARFEETYTSKRPAIRYWAEGGSSWHFKRGFSPVTASISLIPDDPNTAGSENVSIGAGRDMITLPPVGDVPENVYDGVYDFTRDSVQKRGSITLTTRSYTVQNTVPLSSFNNLRYVFNPTRPTLANDLLTGVKEVQLPRSPADVPPITSGYDYVYIGSDQLSTFWAAYAYESRDPSFANETPIYSDDETTLYVRVNHSVFTGRKLVVPRLYLPHITATGTASFPAWYDSVQQFTLSDAKGNVLTAYCADQKTGAEKGHSYRIINLEDATYYSVTEAQKIRTIVNNGYWGTPSGFGSLAAFKEILRQSGKFTADQIAAVTDGIALTATQYAIWTFSNVMNEIQFTNAYLATSTSAPSQSADKEDTDLIFDIYYYLVNLPPSTANTAGSHTAQTTIINEKNFLEDISVTLHSKKEGHPANEDADENNDVFCASLSFKLEVLPTNVYGENLLMAIADPGTDEVKLYRLSGELQPGEILIEPDSPGRYTLTGLCLKEGTQNIYFHLTGTQVLLQNAFLFTSEFKDDCYSQPMVSIASGSHDVNVYAELAFDVKAEDEIEKESRFWRREITVPSTGDGLSPLLWAGLIVCSIAVLLVLKVRRSSRT